MPNTSPSSRKNVSTNKGMPIYIKVGILAAFAVVFLVGMIFLQGNEEKEEQQLELIETNVIYNNIFVNDINVGGLTKQEAVVKLNNELADNFGREKIILNAGGTTYEYLLSDLGARYDVEAAIDVAYDYGRQGETKERLKTIEDLETSPYRIEAMYTYDSQEIREALQTLETLLYVEPTNATLERTGGKFVTTNEVNGQKLNTEGVFEKIVALMETGEGGTISLEVEVVEAEFTAESFKNATSLIGTYTSSFTSGENGRNTNIKTAASKINDHVLYPGEVFSTNKEFGVMTYDNGYRMAPVIIGGELKDDMGGGVCQVSSTLYMALLYAELEIVERQNHSQKVGYMDYGFDATLAGDYIDLKFKNNTDYPVYVETVMSSTSITVNIYGYEIHDPTRKLEFYSTLVETVAAPEDNIIEDPELPLDERVVTTSALNGRRYKTYKKVYENGSLIETVEVNTSYYRPRAAVVRVGTAEGEETVTETPEVTEAPNEAPAQNTEEPVQHTVQPEEPANPPEDNSTVNYEQPEIMENQNSVDTDMDYSSEEAPPIIED